FAVVFRRWISFTQLGFLFESAKAIVGQLATKEPIMKFGQMAKRIFLMVMVNILVMVTITLVLGLLRVGNFFPRGGLAGLAVFSLVWGFAGAFISLALSRVMAKWMMGVKVIPPETSDPTLRGLVETVHGLARAAGLPLPEVGIYE